MNESAIDDVLHPSEQPYAEAQPQPTRYRPRTVRAITLLTLLFTVMLATTAACPLYGQQKSAECPLYPSPHLRMGFNVAKEGGVSIDDYDVAQLHAGWYHDYNQQLVPSHPTGMIYHQMLRTDLATNTLTTTIGSLVNANPGNVWVVGNEPDRYGQDQMTPDQFAAFYHDVYTFLKGRDPTSRVAIGAIVQATPIRLRYLDMVLAAYQSRYGAPLPTDIWTLHNFLLPEQCSWGAHIPPGLETFASEGVPCLTPLREHANIATFQQRILDFRLWMKENGYRDYPLIISEYGILLTPLHGFSYPVVRDYMLASFDFMLNKTDQTLGYPADSNRLVQQFAWFSLNYYAYEPSTGQGLNGNLFDHESRLLMDLGQDYAAYAAQRVLHFTDLELMPLAVEPAMATTGKPVTVHGKVRNRGGVAATDITMRFWLGRPEAGGKLLGAMPVTAQALPDCGYEYAAQLTWTPPTPGEYTIFVDVQGAEQALERTVDNNRQELALIVTEHPSATATATDRTPAPTASPTVTATPSPTPTVVDQQTVRVSPGEGGYLQITGRLGQRIMVTIGGNAVDEPTTFTIRLNENPKGLQGDYLLIDEAFTIQAERDGVVIPDFVFRTPVVIALDYSARAEGTVNNDNFTEEDIGLYTYDETRMAWRKDGITLLERNSEENCIQFVVAHLREFALLWPTGQNATPTPNGSTIYVPLIMDESLIMDE